MRGWANRQQTPTTGARIARLATRAPPAKNESLNDPQAEPAGDLTARRHNQSHAAMSAAGNKTKNSGSRSHQRPLLKPIHAAAIVSPAVIVPSVRHRRQSAQTAAGALVSIADNHAASSISSSMSRIENCQAERLPASAVDSFAVAVHRRASRHFRHTARATIVNPA